MNLTGIELERAFKRLNLKPSAAARALGVERSTLWRWLQHADQPIPNTAASNLVRCWLEHGAPTSELAS